MDYLNQQFIAALHKAEKILDALRSAAENGAVPDFSIDTNAVRQFRPLDQGVILAPSGHIDFPLESSGFVNQAQIEAVKAGRLKVYGIRGTWCDHHNDTDNN